MKQNFIPFILALSILTAFTSCKKNDESDTTEHFTYKYDGQNVDLTQWVVQKNGDRFVIQANNSDQNIAIELNKYGDLATMTSYSSSNFNFPLSESFYIYSSYFLDFNLDDIDTANKMIKVSFDGKLFEDNYDITSTTHTVSGDLKLKYVEVAETELAKVSCKIEGNDWHSTSGDQTYHGNDNYELSYYSDDAYAINFHFNSNTLGTCNNQSFTDNSSLRISLDIYDPQNDELINCSTSGTITISNYTPATGFNYAVLEGSFSFTAVNPQNQQNITVNNGQFKVYLQ